MARLRKDQTEAMLESLDSATSGPLEEITVVRSALLVALRIVLESEAGWPDLVDDAAHREGWDSSRSTLLHAAARPDEAVDPEAVLWTLWDLVTELNERRTLGS